MTDPRFFPFQLSPLLFMYYVSRMYEIFSIAVRFLLYAAIFSQPICQDINSGILSNCIISQCCNWFIYEYPSLFRVILYLEKFIWYCNLNSYEIYHGPTYGKIFIPIKAGYKNILKVFPLCCKMRVKETNICELTIKKLRINFATETSIMPRVRELSIS